MSTAPSDQAAGAALRVVLAEDHFLVREGTRRLLEESGQVDVVASVGSGDELRRAVDQLEPDVVITDIRMPPGHHMEGIEAAHAIRESHPRIGIVVLSQHADEAYVFALLRDGTDGLAYLLKDRVGDLDQLCLALTEVAAGRSMLDARVVESLVQRRAHDVRSPLAELTRRELDVLGEMAEGKTNAGIAGALYLAESTVEKHVNSIFLKLGLTQRDDTNRRVAAVLAYLRDARDG